MLRPFDERTINILENLKVPNTYWANNTLEYKYWFRSLLHKIDSSLIFEGLPIGWSDDFFHLCLWAVGFVGVFKTNRQDLKDFGDSGVLFQPGTIGGFDFYYQPEIFKVANPKYQKDFTIGKDCELIKLTPDFLGIFDILDYYSKKLAEISKGIDMGLINAKFPVIFSADNEAQAETLKKVYDKVQAGESLVVWKNTNTDEVIPTKEPFNAWANDFKNTYIVHNLLEDMQIILDSFYVEIGLPVAIEKKERIITSEADFASAQSQARISCWLETLKESLEKVNSMFNTNITVEAAYESRENDPDGDDRNPDDVKA
jgi:hypothetical protein